MSRAHGRNNPRRPQEPELTDAQRAAYGMIGTGPIPGPPSHIINHPSVEQKVPAPKPLSPFRGQMAHGVRPDGQHWDRTDPAGRKPGGPYGKPPGKPPPSPVPVYIVETAGTATPLLSAAPHHITVNAAGGDPIRVCGKDQHRTSLLLLNESPADGIRLGQKPGDVDNGAGALLAPAATSYLRLTTQDEMWVVSDTGNTPVLSVIQEFERAVPW